jgi:hypothetical protein
VSAYTYTVEAPSGFVYVCRLLTPSQAVEAHIAAELPIVSRPDTSGLPPAESPPPTPEEVVARSRAMEAMVCAVVVAIGKPGAEPKPVKLSASAHDPAAGVFGLSRLPPLDYTALVNGYGERLGGLADELGSFLG